MPTFSILEQWLGSQIVALAFIGFAILMGFAMLYFSVQSKRSALVRDRTGKTEDTFAEYLAAYGFDPAIARATYRYLQQIQQVEFPIVPLDDLDRDLGMDDDEVTRSLRDLLAETRREYLPGLIDTPLVTVADLVRYVQASPRLVQTSRQRIA